SPHTRLSCDASCCKRHTCCFRAVRHYSKRSVRIPKSDNPTGSRGRDALYTKNPPLDHVDELVEKDRLILRLMRLQEAGVEIGDAIGVPTLEAGKLRQPPRR